MADTHEKGLKQYMRSSSKMSKEIPKTMKSFSQLHKDAMEEGSLSTKDKELIALGIAISIHCEGCIQAHVKAAVDAGATRAEMHETISVAILMSGGPGTVYGAMAHEAIDEFLD